MPDIILYFKRDQPCVPLKVGRTTPLNGTRPAWSPGGATIAFGQPTAKIRGCCSVTDLMPIDSNGGHRRLLVRNGGRPTWSPDGSRLVFQRIDGTHFDLAAVTTSPRFAGWLSSVVFAIGARRIPDAVLTAWREDQGMTTSPVCGPEE